MQQKEVNCQKRKEKVTIFDCFVNYELVIVKIIITLMSAITRKKKRYSGYGFLVSLVCFSTSKIVL
jgi:hypothetical protein